MQEEEWEDARIGMSDDSEEKNDRFTKHEIYIKKRANTVASTLITPIRNPEERVNKKNGETNVF